MIQGMTMQKYLDPAFWQETGNDILNQLIAWFTSPQFYAQVAAILLCVAAAWFLARMLNQRVSWFSTTPEKDVRFYRIRQYVHALSDLLFALLCYVFLGFAVDIVTAAVGVGWLVKLAQGLAVIFLLYTAINRFITHPMLRTAMLYIGIPVATLQVFEYLDETTAFLDSISMEAGNIRISLYFLIKAAIAGGFFFWLGTISNRTGQNAIRSQDALDLPTKELFAKLFQIALFAAIFILLLQVLGLDLTALAVIGGAIGVGIGFGLQQIASNFISGIILLIERTLVVGDYIELEDGRAGILSELNMRSATLETYDGKEIMVPNEKFITSVFINWTRDDPRQRYEVEFTVAYDTDIRKVPGLIVKAVSKHPGVLQEPEKPDCELRGFGDSGIEFALEFWIKGIDDGKNRISADLLTIIWETLMENDIRIPYPQREVRILEDKPKLAIRRKETTARKS
ncbi:mechanosensitive ion channel family protein [Salaquimonas pukyongi]|uniref:mechanosensitive ion channel family protein n=1 Tax=Salaquimonas pukyongi TaxID=2712698 RepID=UPI0019675F59|nr:mechanosensitive ion channel domain-containing protein [Salaquimonas pukyongi]